MNARVPRFLTLVGCLEALLALLAGPASASPPRPQGEELAATTSYHAAGLTAALSVGSRASAGGGVRYRLSRLRPYSLSWWSLQAAVTADPWERSVAVEAGAALALHPILLLPGLGVSADLLGQMDEGHLTMAFAPGLVVTPYRMTADKWGDLSLRFRGVVPLWDRSLREDRFEVLVTLLFQFGGD